ncbi:hypothetical protein IAQ61_011343 [Plenodomus lingam]|uniref:uncharacterized protein n=1 Tax=Leptosphaeria maculans TaxID=5022 RepID=UPI003332A733|nr:hypothetical protein IAQ61_011343 [Plenodomus lingam]
MARSTTANTVKLVTFNRLEDLEQTPASMLLSTVPVLCPCPAAGSVSSHHKSHLQSMSSRRPQIPSLAT